MSENSQLAMLSSQLKSFPSGELIGLLEMDLETQEYYKACESIYDMIYDAILSVAHSTFKNEIEILEKQDKHEEARHLISGLLAVDPIYMKVIKNALEIGVLMYVPLEKVQAYRNSLSQILQASIA